MVAIIHTLVYTLYAYYRRLSMTHLSITFPEDLKTALDQEVRREHTKRSTLIQAAVRFYLGIKKRRALNEVMKEGYLEMAKMDKQINEEWESTMADGLDD